MVRKVTDYLDETAKLFPEKIGFCDQKEQITFAQLRYRGLCIAEYLVKKNISKKPVLLFAEKGVSLITMFMGVAYSGNFYSPLDTKMPVERINKIIDTLNPAIVITDKKHYESVCNFNLKCEVLVYEEILNVKVEEFTEVFAVSQGIIDTDVLYVLFTSGSTGVPKGVIINHRAVIDFTDWISDTYGFDETTVFANQAQLYFDLSIQDVYAPLRNGSTTILIPNRLYSSPVRVWKTIIEHKVNTLVWIPSIISMFANLDILRNVEKASLKSVLFCGEVMPMKQLNYWIKQYPDTTFANLYGPTECTEACTYYTIDREFSDDDILPMGKACENSEAIILDEEGALVSEPGQIGELCMRGTCLSSGYYENPEKTNEVFVQNPLNTSYPELIYRTGDLVCYNEFHELVFVCRKDFQIKIRGYRVELGEVEAAALGIENIEYCCCLFDKKNEKIVLVYTGGISPSQLNEILSHKIQDYMIPSEYYQRDSMLFNNNGKVDRKALEQVYIQK